MDIPAQYNAKDVEEKIYQQWLDQGCFNADVKLDKQPFSIVIPPPNVTGILHMGHALNNTIQDVFIRYQRMQGKEALWMPGTDHAGIATQNVVERKLAQEKLRKEDLGREEFTKRLWGWKEEYGSTILNQLKKLGASCDWRRARFTMDDEYSDAVKEVFIRLYEKGLIYRGNYIVNWCPRCKTALSDEESAHKEIDGFLYYIKYPVKDQKDYVVVATTRPETMFGDTAVMINPNDERYAWLKGKKVILPILERELSVIEDEAVDPAFGTGVVKVTPSHDPVDFATGKKHNLEFINIMHEDARLNENAGDFAGMDRFEARAALLEVLEEKKLVEKKEPYKLSAGHCYRCHTIIEPRVSLQWFVKMKPLAKKAIEVVEEDQIQFIPARWKKVYLNWMYNIQDWCISRQIWWGHRLPVYYCSNCVEQTGKIVESRKLKVEKQRGVIVAKERPEKCPDCGSRDLVQDEDVLDTWFSSWLWPFATFGWPKPSKDLDFFYPTRMLATGPDILFFWVARMVMAGLEFMNKIPFSYVALHGIVRDAKGIKMSKSLNNTIDPISIIDKFGADSLRFSLMMLAASGSDVFLSEEKFVVGRNFCNKIWNATRFLLLKVRENEISLKHLELNKVDVVDAWVISEFNKIVLSITQELDKFSVNEATKKLYDFFWHVFCDWYIEIIKDNFSEDKTRVAVYVLIETIKLLHPVMPFITEEIFSLVQQETGLESFEKLIYASWPKAICYKKNKDLDVSSLESLLETVKEVRSIKNDLGLGQKKIGVSVKVKDAFKSFWQDNTGWFKRLTYSSEIVFNDHQLPRVLYSCPNWEINLDIVDVDIGGLISSFEKKIAQLKNVFSKVTQRLNNENFIQNASLETVEQEKEKYREISGQLKRLEGLKEAFCK